MTYSINECKRESIGLCVCVCVCVCVIEVELDAPLHDQHMLQLMLLRMVWDE